MARLLAPTDQSLAEAVQVLQAGGLVVVPTETVYGLAALALDPKAVAKIYAAKDRPAFNPLILHVAHSQTVLDDLFEDGIVDLGKLSVEARTSAKALVTSCWPGPLTLVLPRGSAVPDLTVAGLDTVAVRSPNHPVAQRLLAKLGRPLAAPSANRSGALSPTRAKAVNDDLGDVIDLILDGGPCKVGVESTVLHLAKDGTPTLLRPGAVSRHRLAAILGRAIRDPKPSDTPRSPGMGERHYAPNTRLVALPAPVHALDLTARDELRKVMGPANIVGVLSWTKSDAAKAELAGRRVVAQALTSTGDPAEAARNLFVRLRTLDKLGADILLVEPCPPADQADLGGLEHAVADRVARASVPLAELARPKG
jgi:L-threonylcarbamoyladenylate synthase